MGCCSSEGEMPLFTRFWEVVDVVSRVLLAGGRQGGGGGGGK